MKNSTTDVEAEAGPKVGPPAKVQPISMGVSAREAVAKQLLAIAKNLITASVKYKGYTIEKSGDNYYVKDPSGHRAFDEVPANIETAKKWIDAEIHDKKKTSSVANELLVTAKELMASVELRLQTMEDMDTPILRLPVVKRGSMAMINMWAKSQGFKFVKDSSVYGGYWNDPATGESYLIT